MTEQTIVAWAQWRDLATPDGVELLSAPVDELAPEALQRVTFYVPRYFGGGRVLEVMREMPSLSVVQLPSAGFDGVTSYLRTGVTLCNARGVHDESTAELAVTLALAGSRGFPDFAAAAVGQRWAPARYTSLTDSRIAVVGYGSIGKTIVRMLSGFSVEVTPFSRRGTDGARPISELRDEIGDFDVIMLVVPLTEQTAHMVDADFLARMHDGALMVNVARGKVVDTDALVAELNSGRLRAAIDVVDPEPLPAGHPLWTAPNCVITPHVGGNTTAFEPRMRSLIYDQLTRLTRGEELANVVARG